jgi:hypothetical protein
MYLQGVRSCYISLYTISFDPVVVVVEYIIPIIICGFDGIRTPHNEGFDILALKVLLSNWYRSS